MSADGFHPSSAGYARIADLFLDVARPALLDQEHLRGPIPTRAPEYSPTPIRLEDIQMTHSIQSTVDIRRADTRFATDAGWLESRHCFSFARHYDPSNTHHGLLLVSNDDIVAPRTGFDTHPHQDMEIVTWVMSGELEHKDTLGNKGLIYPGLAQRMSAGRGIWHSEKNNTSDAPVHFVQMWVRARYRGHRPRLPAAGHQPRARQGRSGADRVGPRPRGGDRHSPEGRRLWGGRLKPGETVSVPDGQFVHLYVARGGANLENAGYPGQGRRGSPDRCRRAEADRRPSRWRRSADLANRAGARGLSRKVLRCAVRRDPRRSLALALTPLAGEDKGALPRAALIAVSISRASRSGA